MIELGISNAIDGWRGVVHMGEVVIWTDPKAYETSARAREAANAHAVDVFRGLFSMETADFSAAVEVLKTIDPAWLGAEALSREEFGGKSFTENVLDIIRERISAT